MFDAAVTGEVFVPVHTYVFQSRWGNKPITRFEVVAPQNDAKKFEGLLPGGEVRAFTLRSGEESDPQRIRTTGQIHNVTDAINAICDALRVSPDETARLSLGIGRCMSVSQAGNVRMTGQRRGDQVVVRIIPAFVAASMR